MDFLEQLKAGLSAAQKIPPIPINQYPRLIICGMGGSIMPAEALAMLWLEKPSIYINRTAYLPHWTGAEHAVICISWSGNTAETINCFQEAVAKKLPVWVITSGGRLAELASQQGQPLVLLPPGLNPRDALGLMLSALLTLISRSDIIEGSVNFSSFPSTFPENLAKNLAVKIGPKTPLLYTSYPWRFLGSFWKIFFNENAKIHAFFNYLPGAGHNEVAGVRDQDPHFFYLLLADTQDHPENIKAIDQLENFLKNRQAGYEVIPLVGRNRFEKVLGQYLLASATSVELAHQRGVDPRSTETIESFKRF